MRLRYNTASNIRKTLSKINNMVLAGEIDTKQANTIILGCNAILSSIRIDEQEKKINELEVMTTRILSKKPIL